MAATADSMPLISMEVMKNTEDSSQVEFRRMLDSLRNKDENIFLNYTYFDVNFEDGTETLLQVCAMNNLVRSTEKLINAGADRNKKTIILNRTPLELAVMSGYYQIANLLLKKNSEAGDSPDQIGLSLCECLRCYDEEETDNKSSKKCFDLLMNCENIHKYVNYKDEMENTPLHYAARYTNSEVVLELLKQGALLSNKNKLGFYDLDHLDTDILEKHFNSCIRLLNRNSNVKEVKETKNVKGVNIEFNYKNIVPDKSELTNLLEEERSEMIVINILSKRDDYKQLLIHPLVTSLINLKLKRMPYWFLGYFVVYLLFWTCLLGDHLNKLKFSGFTFMSIILCIIILISNLFVTKENHSRSSKKYKCIFDFITQAENIITIILLINICIPLFVSIKSIKPFSTTSVLMASFQMVLVIGLHPKVSSNILILRQVSWNFFKILMLHIVILLAFSLGFHMVVFSDTSSSFNSISTSILKTLAMLTGQLDTTGIEQFPVFSKIFFGVSLFMIVIVFVNVLIGLAVNDIEKIRNNNELYAWTARVQLIVMCSQFMKMINFDYFSSVIDSTVIFPKQKERKYVMVLYEQEMRSKKNIKFDRKTIKKALNIAKVVNREENALDKIFSAMKNVEIMLNNVKEQ